MAVGVWLFFNCMTIYTGYRGIVINRTGYCSSLRRIGVTSLVSACIIVMAACTGTSAVLRSIYEIMLMTALYYMCDVLEHLSVNEEAMKKNLGIKQEKVLSEWLQFRLAPEIGRKQAQKKLQEIFHKQEQHGGSFKNHLAADPVIAQLLEAEDFAMLEQPEKYIGRITDIIEEVLNQVKAARKNEPEELFP